MIQRTPSEREYYEQRLKVEMDQPAYVAEARSEGELVGFEKGERAGLEKGERAGLEKGMTRGAIIGNIEALQEVLGADSRSRDELAKLDFSELNQLASQLREQLRRRD